MKVLFCHNYYRDRGGEDQSFESEVEMLRSQGDEVITFVRRNSDLADNLTTQLRVTGRTLHSQSARRKVAELIREHRPDIMHCNNLFPQISHSIYKPAHAMGVPVVQALRNYRSFCANAFFYRDQRVCTDCLDKRASFASIRHGCYRNSSVASAVVTTMQLLQRSLHRMKPMVDVFFTPSEFAREVYISGGYDADSIVVKYNFIHPDPGVGSGDSNAFVYVGRLSQEKGLHLLIEAWSSAGLTVPLKIIGDGPMRSVVEEFARKNQHVQYSGGVALDEVLSILGSARCLIMPSLWYETFGRTMAEAFSRGTPVVASRLGAMSELVQDGQNGLLFSPGDAADLARAIRQIRDADAARYERFRLAARDSYTSKYTRDVNYRQLRDIYEIARRRQREKSPAAKKKAILRPGTDET